jgi:hypothetical protein
MKDEDFSLNLLFKYWGRLKFVYEALNQTAPNRFVLNQTMQSQTKTCIA